MISNIGPGKHLQNPICYREHQSSGTSSVRLSCWLQGCLCHIYSLLNLDFSSPFPCRALPLSSPLVSAWKLPPLADLLQLGNPFPARTVISTLLLPMLCCCLLQHVSHQLSWAMKTTGYLVRRTFIFCQVLCLNQLFPKFTFISSKIKIKVGNMEKEGQEGFQKYKKIKLQFWLKFKA